MRKWLLVVGVLVVVLGIIAFKVINKQSNNVVNEPVITENMPGEKLGGAPQPIQASVKRPNTGSFATGLFIPQINVSKNYQPLTLQDLDIKTNIIGNVATTTYEMTFHNPNSATLEAEFIFPLNENQTIAAVALDINGKMREGVVVEKTKARQTFEAVVRQGVDPLLVEKTSGNQFKTRIYPFSPNGTRKIRITLEEFLNKDQGQYKYNLPLQFKQELKNFSLDIEIPANIESAPEITTDLPDFKFTKTERILRSHFAAKDFLLDNTLSFTLPYKDKEQLFTHKENNKIYFYGNLDITQQDKAKTLPKKIVIVWDSSLSGNKRDIKKETELLKNYLQKVQNADISFIPFNIEQGQSRSFSLKNGKAAELFTHIDNIVYDGATKFAALDLSKITADEILFFTDGVNTFDKQAKLSLPKIPMYIINSSAQYEPGLLTSWANKTYGSFINLTNVDETKALSLLTRQPLRIISYKANNTQDIYPVVGSEITENISIAGISTKENNDLEIVLGYDSKTPVVTKKLTIKTGGNNPAVARLWAMKKIQDLEQDPQGNKEQILKLGQDFSIVTSGTSLLVLENASDYARYNITPPAELLNEYNRIVKNNQNQEATRKENAWKDAQSQANAVKSWWKTDFKIPDNTKQKTYTPLKDEEEIALSASPAQTRYSRSSRASEAPAASAAFDGAAEAFAGEESSYSEAADSLALADLRDASLSDSSNEMRRSSSASIRRSSMSRVASSGSMASSALARDVSVRSSSAKVAASSSPANTNSIQVTVKAWDPDTPYLKILKNSKDAELYSDYLKLKTGYSDQPSFYFDITDEFIRRNQLKEALVVLSNITEMELDNVELLRVAANKLMQMKQYKYAVDLFEKITQLRDEDPQSFRDLALAYWANGDYQKAFDQFYFVLQKNWARSNQLKQIVFVELNNLLKQYPQIKKKDLPKDLVFYMPVDIRVILSWSSDNTDIDLHVIDPFNEECFYGHTSTVIGGRYPFDFTQGFGPEEFMLKKAADGKYLIKTNNFADHRQSLSGPTTLYLDIYTNYARPTQKHQRVLVRTKDVKDKKSIGEIVWESNK